MGKLAKFLFRLLVLAVLALAGYAMIADLPAPQQERVIPLDAPKSQ